MPCDDSFLSDTLNSTGTCPNAGVEIDGGSGAPFDMRYGETMRPRLIGNATPEDEQNWQKSAILLVAGLDWAVVLTRGGFI